MKKKKKKKSESSPFPHSPGSGSEEMGGNQGGVSFRVLNSFCARAELKALYSQNYINAENKKPGTTNESSSISMQSQGL